MEALHEAMEILAAELSEWADPLELESLLEEAFAAAVADTEPDICTPYGRGFGEIDMRAVRS